jgi:isocitrate dehydrogenase
MQSINLENKQLTMITNRGLKWPDGFNETYCTDHWRCRFKPSQDKISIKKTLLICYLLEAKIDVIKQKTYMNLMENLAIHY